MENSMDNEKSEHELEDTVSSPIKKNDVRMEDRESTDSGAKRRLLLITGAQPEDDFGAGTIPMITDTSTIPDATKERETDTDRVKRSKKAGADSPSLGSAGSREESVWLQ
jgi:hypothetical protein